MNFVPITKVGLAQTIVFVKFKNMPHKKKPGIYHTKTGQPYRILSNGKARFVKKSSVKKKPSGKKRGGSIRVGGGIGSMLGKRLDRATSRVVGAAKGVARGYAKTARSAVRSGVRAAKGSLKSANYVTGGSVAVGGRVKRRRK